jgi:hypothetical protein
MELSAVWPYECAHSVLFVVGILSLVFAAVIPFGFAHAMHFVVLPITLVFSVVAPDVNPLVKLRIPLPWI